MAEAKAFITGLEGPRLGAAERDFLRGERPWGLILFLRNCREAAEIADLVAAFRDAVGRADAPVLIDQEGGRVQRLKPPGWRRYPPGRAYGALYERDPEAGLAAAFAGARLIADDLHALGITVDCLPLLDVPQPEGHEVIGDRAYARAPAAVAAVARAVADGLLAGGVLPIAKHIPGHGRAASDSHLELPVVTATRAELEAIDFPPFRALADLPLAMTAHVVYTALDPVLPATTSPTVVALIREELGFDGCLMGDDVSMQALAGTIGERTRALFAAGCDLALHCNGKLDEMVDVAAASPMLAGRAAERADRALACLHPPEPFDRAAAEATVAALVAAAEAMA